jgi:hypothetical protein
MAYILKLNENFSNGLKVIGEKTGKETHKNM